MEHTSIPHEGAAAAERFFPDTLRLTFERTGRTVQIQKLRILAGRDETYCDLALGREHTAIARIHASFHYMDGGWFLRDEGAMNGTTLNGTRIAPEKLYPLAPNDVITFAESETVVFYKKDASGDLAGTLVDGKYRLLRKLRSRPPLEDYLAINEHSNRMYVVKVFDKSGVWASYRDNFVREASVLVKLNHPGIPMIYDIIENDTQIIEICEHVQGKTLDAVLEAGGAQPVEWVLDWAKQLCDILSYIHGRTPPFIHREVEPSNVVIQPDGSVKLIGFDYVPRYDILTREMDYHIYAVPGYCAPELIAGHSDARTDIYMLGATVHHLLTGKDPLKPPYALRPIRQIDPDLPRELEAVIQKCTELDPAKRYQSAEELLRALNGAQKKPGLFSRLFGRK